MSPEEAAAAVAEAAQRLDAILAALPPGLRLTGWSVDSLQGPYRIGSITIEPEDWHLIEGSMLGIVVDATVRWTYRHGWIGDLLVSCAEQR